MKRKHVGELRKNAGISLHPAIIALLEKYRGRKSKSLYAEEIISDYFRRKAKSLDVSEKTFLEGESL